MSKSKLFFGILILVLTLPLAGSACIGDGEVSFDQIFTSPDKYNGEEIIIEGFYFQGFEVNILCEMLECYNGHLSPRGSKMWMGGGMPREVYDELYQQQMTGSLERYGKVRVKGLFEYGGEYGHLGMYSHQIIPLEVEFLSWSPPEE